MYENIGMLHYYPPKIVSSSKLFLIERNVRYSGESEEFQLDWQPTEISTLYCLSNT